MIARIAVARTTCGVPSDARSKDLMHDGKLRNGRGLYFNSLCGGSNILGPRGISPCSVGKWL